MPAPWPGSSSSSSWPSPPGCSEPKRSGCTMISSAKALLGRIGLAAMFLFVVGFWTVPALKAKAAPKTRKQVRFWHMWTAEWKDVVDKIVARFNESQTEYQVVALSVPATGADSKFLLGVMGGDPPDVMAQWNPVIPVWADNGLITPLDDLMSPEEKRIFEEQAYPVVKKVGKYKDKLYGMSIGINMSALYYLPDDFKRAGIDPNVALKSLEGLDAAAPKLDRLEKDGGIKRVGWMPKGFAAFAQIFGGGLYDSKAEKVTLDTEPNRHALQYLVDSRKRLGYDKVVRFESGLNTASFAAGWPFMGGAYSVTVDGQWRVEQLRKYAPNLKYLTAPVPPPKGGRTHSGMSGGNFMIVPRGAKESRGAWDFIKFWSGLTNPERAAEFYTMGGWLPLTPAIANAKAYRDYIKKYPQFKTFVDLMDSTTVDVLPPVPYQTFLNDEISKMEDSAVRGTLSPNVALAGLEQKVQAELTRRRSLGE
ncbi:ABC transporter substrate-binding protein [bacterium]|nr:MAG: ABC transporter substrate-binding protein [bacterium]